MAPAGTAHLALPPCPLCLPPFNQPSLQAALPSSLPLPSLPLPPSTSPSSPPSLCPLPPSPFTLCLYSFAFPLFPPLFPWSSPFPSPRFPPVPSPSGLQFTTGAGVGASIAPAPLCILPSMHPPTPLHPKSGKTRVGLTGAAAPGGLRFPGSDSFGIWGRENCFQPPASNKSTAKGTADSGEDWRAASQRAGEKASLAGLGPGQGESQG